MTLYDYYRTQRILPTHGGFDTEADLKAHEQHRRRLFTDKLHLPPRMFDGAHLLEFGPDSGENSLVFAKWGAKCVLSEPNTQAHRFIHDYFERFIKEQPVEVYSHELLNFPEGAFKYDFIDAEGFIYAIRPTEAWIDKVRQLVRPEGFVILFYIEHFGSFMEFMLKVVHAHYRRLTGHTPLDAAKALFKTKWDSIPHRRSIEAWTMDVLLNPFVRFDYCLDPAELCRQMYLAGFRLYSSWPIYQDPGVHWFKHCPSAEVELNQQANNILSNRLAYLLGRRPQNGHVTSDFVDSLLRLVSIVDTMIDGVEGDTCAKCIDILGGIQEGPVIDEYCKLFRLLQSNCEDGLIEFCNTSEPFIRNWGMPSHFAVFRKA